MREPPSHYAMSDTELESFAAATAGVKSKKE